MSELQRLQQVFDARRKLRAEKLELIKKGMTYDAARQAVYRMHGAAPSITRR